MKGKSRGYAFVTFRHEKDANYAVHRRDGRRIDGRRILVTKEMGRTSERWKPRKLGGGKGGESRRADGDWIIREVQREIRKEREDQEDRKREERPAHTKTDPAQAPKDEEREPGEI